MTSCEKCWRDAEGDPHKFERITLERIDDPCTPEEQAGGEQATYCFKCSRRTVHVLAEECVICGWSGGGSESDPIPPEKVI